MPYWRLFYHFVWGTKNREPLIALEWERSLHNVIVAKAKSLGAFVYRAGGTEDHVHLVASVPPKVSLSTFIGQVKGNSSHFVNHELDLDVPFAWQAKYGVVSFEGPETGHGRKVCYESTNTPRTRNDDQNAGTSYGRKERI